ncbi:MAG: tetratricopeptide repeat protein [Candidatus Methylomirabilales bacterium]
MRIFRVLVRMAPALLVLVSCATKPPPVQDQNLAASHYNVGVAYLNARNLRQALPELRKATELDPSDPNYHNALGMALMLSGQLDDAMKAFEEALRTENRFSEAKNNLAGAYLFKGDVQKARTLYLEVLKDPFYPTPHFIYLNLAKINEREGKFEEAIQEYKRALDIRSDYEEAHNSLGLLYLRMGKMDLAIEELSEATRLSPNTVDYHRNLGTAYLQAGKRKRAQKEFEKVLQLEPNGRSADYARRMLEEVKR